jgi:hypothetical protein
LGEYAADGQVAVRGKHGVLGREAAIAEEVGCEADYLPVENDGARKAAERSPSFSPSSPDQHRMPTRSG